MISRTRGRRIASNACVAVAACLFGAGCQRGPAVVEKPKTVEVLGEAEEERESAAKPPAEPALALVLPEPASKKTNRWLEQGWDDAVRTRYHHASQGSATFPVPYEWLVALEQPSATPEVESPLLVEADYMSRFGFVPGVAHPEHNPDGLPVGFARVEPFESPLSGGLNPNPATGQPYTAVGFTCAACHTGQLEFGQTRLLIDGGPATTNLGAFRDALQLALGGLQNPTRAKRFVARLLPHPDASAAQQQGLQAQLTGFSAAARQTLQATQRAVKARLAKGEELSVEGFLRLDALARIGNQVFWTDQRRSLAVTDGALDANFALPNAPVNFPPIWDAPWFDWVQYNGSIMQPMFRNFTEALGVGAQINLGDAPDRVLRTTVDVRALHQIERDLAGPPPFEKKSFQGLRSPKWPEDVLGKIDRKLAARGESLYAERCQSCHLPPPSSREFWSKKHWKKDRGSKRGERYLVLEFVPLEEIGTDPAQAANLRSRVIQLPDALGGGTVGYGEALKAVEKAIDAAYEAAGIPAAERPAFSGGRPNLVRADLAYRPRPLNGIWATPPFLHNGAVPSLYELLSPVAERSQTFYVGSREFDPKRIGLAQHQAPGLFEIDTRVKGNLNTGHEFADREASGVIGPALTHDDRVALIEYIKTL